MKNIERMKLGLEIRQERVTNGDSKTVIPIVTSNRQIVAMVDEMTQRGCPSSHCYYHNV
jgi:hypothetical protein